MGDDLPGCYGAGSTQTEAVGNASPSISAYRAWLGKHRGNHLSEVEDPYIDVHVVEVFHAFESEPGYIVNAFFEDDRRALSEADVDGALLLLDYTRRDLLALVTQIPPEQLNMPGVDGAFGTLDGILRHIAGAEWWYLDRLELAVPGDEMPEETFARLEKVRERLRISLPGLVGDERVETHSGERWSARKIVRRALWHERDHTQQIAKLVRAGRTSAGEAL